MRVTVLCTTVGRHLLVECSQCGPVCVTTAPMIAVAHHHLSTVHSAESTQRIES